MTRPSGATYLLCAFLLHYNLVNVQMAKKQGTPSSKPKKQREAPKEDKKQASASSKASRFQEATSSEGRYSRKTIERKLGEDPENLDAYEKANA